MQPVDPLLNLHPKIIALVKMINDSFNPSQRLEVVAAVAAALLHEDIYKNDDTLDFEALRNFSNLVEVNLGVLAAFNQKPFIKPSLIEPISEPDTDSEDDEDESIFKLTLRK